MYEIIIGAFALAIGGCVGYYTRQVIARRRAGTIEKISPRKLPKQKLKRKKSLKKLIARLKK